VIVFQYERTRRMAVKMLAVIGVYCK